MLFASKKSSLISILAAALLVGACGAAEDPNDSDVQLDPARGIGKADLAGSCMGSCGTRSPDGCWCDSQCLLLGDCCQDKVNVCDAPHPCPQLAFPGPEFCPGGKIVPQKDQYNCIVGFKCEAKFCGGIAGIPCPAGFFCQLDGNYPDAGGKCLQCQPVLCEVYCPYGFATDANGCAVCKCNPSPNPCFGAWLDQNGKCRSPADGVYPDKCCAAEKAKKCAGAWLDQFNNCRGPADGVLPGWCCPKPPRTVASGACIKNSNDTCTTDADCMAGGCGGELCFNPAESYGLSTCECTKPTGVSCGCVNGKCNWWK